MRRLPLLALCLIFAFSPCRSRADEVPATALPEPAASSTFVPSVKSTALFLTGAAAAFATHESCHLAMNLMLGSVPHFRKVTFLGFIPFFAIAPAVSCSGTDCVHDGDLSHWGPGRAGFYSIVAAGLQCQQVTDEIILSTDPYLSQKSAPFRKGVLAFNVLLSIGYAYADWAGIEPPAGDVGALDRMVHLPHGTLAAAILVPALLDILRYYLPDVSWLPYVSRASKGMLVGFAFAL